MVSFETCVESEIIVAALRPKNGNKTTMNTDKQVMMKSFLNDNFLSIKTSKKM